MADSLSALPLNSLTIFFTGADLNKVDKFGRSPLHVASAVDYVAMVEFLLENGACVDAETFGERQTALHFAAKNDAVNAMKMLLAYKSDINCTDYKDRTPLQVILYIRILRSQLDAKFVYIFANYSRVMNTNASHTACTNQRFERSIFKKTRFVCGVFRNVVANAMIIGKKGLYYKFNQRNCHNGISCGEAILIDLVKD